MTIRLPPATEGRHPLGMTSAAPKRLRLVVDIAMLAVVAVLALGFSTRALAAPVDQSLSPDLETRDHVASLAQACSFCHGLDGRSLSPIFPRLAGQQKDYLSAQIKAFRDKTRTDPPGASISMARMAAGLGDAMIADLAAYYSAQDPVSGSARNPSAVAAGKIIYEHGVPDKILPCLACHGAKAEGAGTTPRLAGQRHLYLERELAAFAANTRADGLMHQESMTLTSSEISAVAAYLAAQSAAKPSGATQTGPVTEAQVADKVKICSSCHAFGGAGVAAPFIFPRLAGQQKDYLSAQIKAFRDKTRTDPPGASISMARMAAGLGDAMIADLAAYYSAESMSPSSAQDLADLTAGKNIYEQGIRDKIPPCLTCHGAKAEGSGTTPRLAGQRRLSLERQLADFAADTRPNALMHKETMNLTRSQISEISAYLAAQ